MKQEQKLTNSCLRQIQGTCFETCLTCRRTFGPFGSSQPGGVPFNDYRPDAKLKYITGRGGESVGAQVQLDQLNLVWESRIPPECLAYLSSSPA